VEIINENECQSGGERVKMQGLHREGTHVRVWVEKDVGQGWKQRASWWKGFRRDVQVCATLGGLASRHVSQHDGCGETERERAREDMSQHWLQEGNRLVR